MHETGWSNGAGDGARGGSGSGRAAESGWARARALPLGARLALAGWAAVAVIGVPLAFAVGSGRDTIVVAEAAGGRGSTGARSASAVEPRGTIDAAPSTAMQESAAVSSTEPPTTRPSTMLPPTTTAPPTTVPPTTVVVTTAPPTTAPAVLVVPTAGSPTTAAVVVTTPPPATVAAAAEPSSDCHPSYDPCVPIASDVDCAGGSGNGPAYVAGPVTVLGTDPYRLDANGDGVGCED